jgi:hypothetical protein
MKKTPLTVLITFLFSFVPLSYAQSHPPTPGPTIASQEKQNKTEPNQTAGKNKEYVKDSLPSPVIAVHAQPSNSESAQQAKPSDNKSTPQQESKFWFDVILIFFTGILAISTIALWCSTRKLASLTYKAFIATNRPRLRIRSLFSDSSMLPNRIYIANVGGSAATDIVFHAVFTRIRGNAREAPWIENLSKSIWHGPNKLAPGEEGMYELRSKADFAVDSIGDKTDITTHRKTLSIIGKVRYRDANDTESKTGFGWGYDPGTGEFSKPEKEDQYNYED